MTLNSNGIQEIYWITYYEKKKKRHGLKIRPIENCTPY